MSRIRHSTRLLPLVFAVVLASVALPAAAADCQLRFNLAGWSAFYKTGSGSGTVTCDNGQSMAVKIRTKGGGITFGKTRIADGRGGRLGGRHGRPA